MGVVLAQASDYLGASDRKEQHLHDFFSLPPASYSEARRLVRTQAVRFQRVMTLG
jgi:hypothetical protein